MKELLCILISEDIATEPISTILNSNKHLIFKIILYKCKIL